MELAILLLLGITVGAIGTLMGVGGGIMVVPVFLYALGFSVQETIGTALVIVFFNGLSGTLAYWRRGLIYFPAAWRFGLATIPGAIVGSYATEYFTGTSFQVFFGIFLLLIALNMYRKCTRRASAVEEGEENLGRRMGLGMLSSVFVGFLSSVLGIGGGIVHVPFMNQVLKYPIKRVIATSTCILLISSSAGLVAHMSLGHVLVHEALATGLGALLGAQLGAALSSRLSPRNLKLAFSTLVLAMGLKLISVAVF